MFSSSTSEERFRERMRRRTTRVIENLEKQSEARRIGQLVADQVLQASFRGATYSSSSRDASNNYNRAHTLAGATNSSSSRSIYHSFNNNHNSNIYSSNSNSNLAATNKNNNNNNNNSGLASSLRRQSSVAASAKTMKTKGGGGVAAAAASADDLFYSTKSIIPPYKLLVADEVSSSHFDDESRQSERNITTKKNAQDEFHSAYFVGNSNNLLYDDDDDIDQVDDDDDDHHDDIDDLLRNDSSERAVQRGSRRGFRESNESSNRSSLYYSAAFTAAGAPTAATAGRGAAATLGGISSSGGDSNSEVDMTTITDAFTDFTTKESKMKEIIAKEEEKKKKKKKFKWGRKWRLTTVKEGDGGDNSENQYEFEEFEEVDDDGFWMCGVCGHVFHSLETAERHEDIHLRHVINSLGWGEDNPNLAFLSTQLRSPDNSCNTTVAAFTDSFWNNGNNMLGNHNGTKQARHQRSRASSYDSNASSESLTMFSRPRRGGRRRPVRPIEIDGLNISEEEAKVEVERSSAPQLMMGGNYYPPLPIDTRQGSAGRYGSQLLEDTLIPKRRRRAVSSSSEIARQNGSDSLDHMYSQQYEQYLSQYSQPHSDPLLMNESILNYVAQADEALLNVCLRATPLILTADEVHAERNLSFLAKDKHYYQEMTTRALARRTNPSNRFRSDADTLLGQLQNKILDAYQLMKEGDSNVRKDQYNKKRVGNDGADTTDMPHTKATLYVNVLVRNSVQVVKYELERLAREKWEAPDEAIAEKYTRFERFRVYAHMNIVKLASIALASDFTPRRIAIQLSNDLYRLLTPRLKRRGVTISTEIEYRVGGYFVLAVNINTIDWARLIKTTNKDWRARKSKWKKEMKHDDDEDVEKHAGWKRFFLLFINFFRRLLSLDKYVILDNVLAWLFHFHWIIHLPICHIAYRTPRLGSTIRKFIISSAIDEICLYVHEKGMEMEIRVCYAYNQASFMLSALREIRADGRQLKKKRQETEAHEVGTILGPLLGPPIKADKGPAVAPPGFEVPSNLEYVGLELDLPVGFRRLRWAYLSNKSSFLTEALWKTESKYEDITVGEWSKHADFIGDPNPPPTVNTDDFVGAEYASSYLMPKSAFVSANMCYATTQIIAYNDYCFCLKTRSKTPDVPFGNTFIAWTQMLVINTGNDSCKMICSVEAEFPNGPPMVARQIQSGMRAGTGDAFVLIGETITKYANAFP